MKKLLAIILLCAILLPARAQEGQSAPCPAGRNELGVALFGGTYYQVSSLAGAGLISLGRSIRDRGLYIGIPIIFPVSVEYAHWFNDRIAVGASLSADIVSFLPEGVIGRVCIMPEFRYKWLNHESFKMYSKIAAGYSEGFELSPGEDGKMTLSSFAPVYLEMLYSLLWDMHSLPLGIQINPVCAEGHTGLEGIDYFCEFGIGPLGFCTFGLKKYF